jgi:PhoPQ-activated pathogenicity-related protein
VKKRSPGAACAMLSLLFGLAMEVRADLREYVAKPEPVFSWRHENTQRSPLETIHELELISQRWQGVIWRHRLQVYQPTGAKPRSLQVLWITGGSPRQGHAALALRLARLIGAPVAFLFNVPNQPLLEGDLWEDELMAETFLRYLKTKDENWPLLFPMVKSAVKAMDALDRFGREAWSVTPEGFVLVGASKRGWTAWLAAVADKRVKAIAPMVIDALNISGQMSHQVKSLGGYSHKISPYTDRGLLPLPETPEAKRLSSLIDPWTYREELTLPKFIINGTNDPYWATDAINLYWNDLRGEKWVLYVPNAAHDLRRSDRDGPDQFDHAMRGLAAFLRSRIHGRALPKLAWRQAGAENAIRVTIDSSERPLGARLWVARAPTRDFRQARWTEQPAEIAGGTMSAVVALPAEGFTAFFGELDFALDGLAFQLSTPIQIRGRE